MTWRKKLTEERAWALALIALSAVFLAANAPIVSGHAVPRWDALS